MREIKYRVWNTISKIMKPFSEIKRCGVFAIADGLNSDDFIILPLKNSILNEYTGLKDKNSVEIYEGDVGNDKFNNKVIVKWNEQFYCYALLTIDEIVKDDWNFDLNDLVEVIGNMYENQELIKEINENR